MEKVIYEKRSDVISKQSKGANEMTMEERKAKAREIADKYFKDAKWWLYYAGNDDSRALTCCARFSVAVEMYELLTGEKYI